MQYLEKTTVASIPVVWGNCSYYCFCDAYQAYLKEITLKENDTTDLFSELVILAAKEDGSLSYYKSMGTCVYLKLRLIIERTNEISPANIY